MNNNVKFGKLQPNGELTDVRLIKQPDIDKCPFVIFDASHYREDGSCRCNDLAYRKTVMRKWGYKKSDFTKVGL